MEKSEYHKLFQLEESHWWYQGLRELILQHLSEFDVSQPRVLDAGCGTGRLLKIIQDKFESFGMDIGRNAIELSKTRGILQLINASVNEMPFPDETFHCIVSLDVLYHSQVVDDEKSLREFHRTLKKSGKLILNLPAYDFLRSKHDTAIHTKRRYTKFGLALKLKSAGFLPLQISYRNFLLFGPIVLWRLFSKPFSRSASHSDLFQIPAPLNWTLLQFLRFENFAMRFTTFPFGSSVFCIARKL